MAAKEKRPRGRPPKHGVYSKFAMMPLRDIKTKEIMEVLSGERHLIQKSDVIVVSLLARASAQVELIDRWFQFHGIFEDEESGRPYPILNTYWKAIQTAAKLCNSLGLSPEGRIKLGLGYAQAEDLVTKIERAREDV